MGKARPLKLLACLPGASNQRAIAERFLRKGGVVTSFADGFLAKARDWVDGENPETEVLPFGQFVLRVAQFAGGELPRIAPGNVELEAVGLACQELPSDSPFFRARSFPGAHRAILEAIHELDAARFPWQDAEEEKLRSLAMIRAELDERLAKLRLSRFTDIAAGLLDRGAVALEQPLRVLVFAFGEYSELRKDLLVWLEKQGVEVVVVVERAGAGQSLFDDSARYAAGLGRLAEPVGESLGLAEALFRGQSAPFAGPAQTEIWRYPDELYEAEWVLREIQTRLDAGMRPERVAVLSRDPERAVPLLLSAGARLGIPVAASARLPLLSNARVRIILQLLEALAKDDPGLLLRLAHTSYLRLPSEGYALLKAQVREANRAKRGFMGLESTEHLPWLAPLHDWMQRYRAGSRKLHEWSEAITDLAQIVDAGGDDFQESPTSDRDVRALDRARAELSAAMALASDSGSPYSLAQFAAVCRARWERAWTLPGSGLANEYRGIRVVSDAQAIREVDLVVGIGLVEGKFPRTRREHPVLSDLERIQINERYGIRLGTSRDSARRERDEFYRLCSSANALILSHPATEDDRERLAAYYLSQVEACGAPVTKGSRERSEIVPAVPTLAADVALAQARREPRGPSSVEFVDRDAIDERFPTPNPLGVRELGEVVACPFRSFVRYRLQLEPGRYPDRWRRLAGLPGEAKLHRAANESEAQTALTEALERFLEEVRGQCPEWESDLLRGGGTRLIEDWVQREFKAREVWPRDPVSDRPSLKSGFISTYGEAILNVKGHPTLRMTRTAVVPPDAGPERRLPLMAQLGLVRRQFPEEKQPLLEIETLSGERQLVCAHLPEGFVNPPGCKVFELVPKSHSESAGWEAMEEESKRAIRAALTLVKQMNVAPSPGQHCATCAYGELCRRSQEYGEEESPFGADTAAA